MNKFWRVMAHEYTRHVMNKRFLFGLLSIPIIIVVVMGISILASVATANNSPVGYVDQSGLLANPIPPPSSNDPFNKPVQLIAYTSESDAQNALDKGQIQAFYVLPANYRDTAQTRLVYLKEPDSRIQTQFEDFLRANLFAGQPSAIAKRLSDGTTFIALSADGKRQMGENEWFNILVPLLSGILFMIVIMTSGGYLMQAVVEEKENRTMEIVVTSVSPNQLMAGKIMGDIAIGFTQLGFWLAFAGVALVIGSHYVDWIGQIHVTSDVIWTLVVTLVPSFVMIAAIMAAVGATVTESREAQQMSGLFSLPIMIPYWLTYTFMTNPNGPVAVGLSFFPLTAPVALPLRIGFTQIPTGQLVLNIAILVICAVAAILFAARAFRLGMLNYGKRLTLRQIMGKAGQA